jgi:hypothetical protein
MRSDDDRPEQIDEYLWPLTGDLSPINWEALAEELHIRDRLAVILAHVREMHVEPRLRRMGPRASGVARAATAAIISGPEDGPPWLQTLKEPVPRALREEWTRLARRLCELANTRQQAATTRRVG